MAATEPGHVIEQFTRYFNSGDIDGLASLYEDGAAFIPEPGTVVSDTAGLRSALQWRLDVPGGEPMEHTSAEVARRQPDGTWKYALDNPYGGEVLGGLGRSPQ